MTSAEASTSTSFGPRIEQVRSLCLINFNGLGVLRYRPTRHSRSSHLRPNLKPLLPLTISEKKLLLLPFNPFFLLLDCKILSEAFEFPVSRMDVLA